MLEVERWSMNNCKEWMHPEPVRPEVPVFVCVFKLIGAQIDQRVVPSGERHYKIVLFHEIAVDGRDQA